MGKLGGKLEKWFLDAASRQCPGSRLIAHLSVFSEKSNSFHNYLTHLTWLYKIYFLFPEFKFNAPTTSFPDN